MTVSPESGDHPEDAPAAVELRAISKRYESVVALDDVSVSVARGRFLVLLGPSGSGKSTLIRCLAGIDHPSSGAIAIGGTVVADDRRRQPPERRDLTMVFQDFALWPHMTVADNVAFALRRRKLSRTEVSARVRSMLDRVGLLSHADRYPHELSGGEQQRVALARALVARPTLLLFDEPLSSLDANLRERLRIEIGTLVRDQGATAVYITHDQREAFALGDEIGILEQGRLVQRGTPETIYGAPATPFVARFTGLSGALRGRLLASASGAAELVHVAIPTSDPRRTLDLNATAMVNLPAGSAVQVMLRPTAVRICRADARAADIRAVVRDSAYHGRGYDYVLELSRGADLAGVFSTRRLTRGETVGVRIDPAGALLFGDDASVNTPPLAPEALVPRAEWSGLARSMPDQVSAGELQTPGGK
ncbi:MAG: ABC transporter ATP-binding protein [Solirubrobacteraceae bacterium]